MRPIVILVTSLLFIACGTAPTSGPVASPDAVRAFYVGLAALQVGDDPRAKDELTKATQLAANEPAVWVNLGILQIRHKDFDAAATSLEKARSLADKNPKIYETIALLEKQRGNFDASQANLQKAIDLDANNVKAIYALAEEKERQTDYAAALELYKRILPLRPNNIALKIDVMRIAARQGHSETSRRLLDELSPTFEHFETEIKSQFKALRETGDLREASIQTAYLRNVLLRHPGFRENINELKYSDTTVGEPFTKPLVLQVPSSSPAPADRELKFSAESERREAVRAKAIYLTGDSAPVLVLGTKSETLVGDARIPFAAWSPNAVTAFDFDYDFRNDIALVGNGGFRLYRNAETGFVDVTPETKLPLAVTNEPYTGAWVFDVESDGDLDVVAATISREPVVFQNNADGTFTQIDVFPSTKGLQDFVAADLDEDGDSDVLLLEMSGRLRFFSNERGGRFVEKTNLPELLPLRSFTVGDVASDSKLDIIVADETGAVVRITNAKSGNWESKELAAASTQKPIDSIIFHDLDNNGAGDLIVSTPTGTRILLDDGDRFVEVPGIDAVVTSAVDMNDDGRTDLISFFGDVFLNRGSKNYKWQDIRPRAAKTTGDQRVNSFGIGGELELRSGLSVQKRLITEPVVHFGLGENASADVLRVIWQNGFVQAEFDLKPNQTIAAEQRLKGSCPHLFAYDGERFRLVKDAPPWSPALGLKINAQDVFGVLETEEWFKVPGEALKPTKANFYELRITGEYWESFYLDQYSLLVVDHPESTEVFTDERFAVPPVPLQVLTTGRTREFASARGNRGQDVSQIVRNLDEKYLDDFERGTFQGVAADHFVELELPADAPADKRIAIIADGWVHPTDASINVQLGQSGKEKPRSLSLEVRDAAGQWKTAKENLGFPAGKMKTLVIEIPTGARAIRLRTNMEVFWDKLAWGVYENGEQNKTTRIELAASDLRYRGFSVIEKADDSSPEKPVYDRVLTTGQRWRDLEGYYTRFGDVLELLTQTDNRIVLMNAGDELVMKFPALPAPPLGYKRDFVLIGNGWIKDGDLNSVFSKTLIPLPTHASNDYSKPPTTLENDPVYQKHKADWLNFHTRYVSPNAFRNALR